MGRKKKEKPVELTETKHPDKAKEWQDLYAALAEKIKAGK